MELPLTPLEFARRTRKLYSEREAVVDGELRLTYQQFFDRCDRWSSALLALGVEKGDRVAYIAPNTHAMLESFYSIPQIGAILVPLNYRLTPDDFAYLINHSGATIVCAHSDYLDPIESIRSQLPNVSAFVALEGHKAGWLHYETLLAEAVNSFERASIPESDLLTINYTSGTTSRPKGVMMTHRNAYINVVGTLLGGTHICLRKVEPAGVFELINKESVTMLCAAPTVLISIANAPEELRRHVPRGVRVVTAGAPPAAATIERVEGELGWVITQAYGLTETSPFITICEPRPEHQELSTGARCAIKACQGVELLTSGELKVADDEGNEVPHDGETLGEIMVRGNAVMKGYYEDPVATADVMRGGWFRTGDAAVVHPNGYAEIRDRLKDVIISGGENISSVEVEGVFLRHPAVQEVAIVGLPHERWGEAPQAFVVLKVGQTASEQELLQFARDNLAHFKAPQGVTFLPELPKTATGKIQKYVLRGRSAISKQ